MEDARCNFTFRDGRRCRMLRAPEHPLLCLHHARQEQRENGAAPPEPPPLVAVGALDNPWAVRRTLKRIFQEMAAGNIEPRKAAVMTHIGQLLLFETRRFRRQRKARPASALAAQRQRAKRP